MASYDFGSAVANALSSSDAEGLIEGVKRAVFDELHLLDPTAAIDDTNYYNHSFIPDFVLRWNESGRKTERQVFLRPSIVSAAVGHDIENLGGRSPVLLALKSSVNPRIEEIAERSIALVPDILVTDVSAVAQIGVDPGQQHNAPLRSLVRSNLVRGGRGLLVSETAERLTSATRHSGDASDLQSFTELVDDVFVSDAAARLHRAAQLLEMGITGDLAVLESDDGEPAQAIGGKLSDAEMRILLPYLLRRRDITADPTYWAHVGSLMNLDLLEAMSEDLEGIDLTPLVVPNMLRWSAMRASATFYGEAIELPPYPGLRELTGVSPASASADAPLTDLDSSTGDAAIALDADPYRWHLHARMLSLVVGEWRIHITPQGRRLRGRLHGSAPARWEFIAERLRAFHLVGVLLNGIQRRVRVSSERDIDVYQDVYTIRESIKDQFQVPEVTVRYDRQEVAADIHVDFTQMLAVADVPVPVGELAAIAVELLTQHNPPDDGQIDRTVLPQMPSGI